MPRLVLAASDLVAHDDRVSDRLVFDVLTAALLLACGVGGAYAALLMSWRARSGSASTSMLFELGNCLSGGVMLGAGFCHLLGEAAREMGPLFEYPMAPLLAGVGFLVTLLADQVAAAYGEGGGHVAPAEVELAAHAGRSAAPAEGDGGGAFGSPVDSAAVHRTAHGARGSARASAEEDRTVPAVSEGASLLGPSNSGAAAAVGRHSVTFTSSLILAIALSVHSVLEGAAMGAQKRLESSFDVFIAILAHKGLASYALGATLLESNVKVNRFNAVVWFFASATPAGIFLGFAISAIASSVISSAATALASGTFMYVAMMEVIPKEFSKGRDPSKLAKVVLLLLGFITMAIVAMWV